MTTETITLPTTLADAQTALLLMADRCNRVQAELDHYVALATEAEAEGTPLVFTVLRRLRIAEKHAAQWEKEATERQAECIRLGARIQELETALRTVESHHVAQNQIKGRDESRSYTLQLVRAALGAD